MISARSFTAIDIQSQTSPSGLNNPRGYWEFLPTAYTDELEAKFPIVIFFHGLGEGGNGSTDLYEVLKNGPPKILNNSNHALYDLFEDEQVIVLSPQVTNNTWWNEGHIRPFLDFVLSHYRVDERRIYFTGLSAGASGIHEFLNDDSNSNQVCAVMPVAVRGQLQTDALGPIAATEIPYWALTAIGDGSSAPVNSVNRIATALTGSPSNVMANHPSPSSGTWTAAYDTSTATWSWVSGTVQEVAGQPHPKLTLYSGSNHNSWDRTYNNPDCWEWLLSQVKPDLQIVPDSLNRIMGVGESVDLEAFGLNGAGSSIPASEIVWESDLAGSLGTGSPISSGALGIGVHTIEARYVDPLFRGTRTRTQLSVLRTGSYRVLTDVGRDSGQTAGNWNNLSDQIDGELTAVVADDGSATGLRIRVIERFDNFNDDGVDDATLYPASAQGDSAYISSAYPQASIQFSGLNPEYAYTFKLFASRSATDNRTTVYTVDGQTQSLNAANNTNQRVTFSNLLPTGTGELVLNLERAAGATYGYLGVVEIETDGVALDLDSLPNRWEREQFGGLGSDNSGDVDLDGYSNFAECAFGSLPNDPLDHPFNSLEVILDDAANTPHLRVGYRARNGSPHIGYEVLGTSDLATEWTRLTLDDFDQSVELVTVSDAADPVNAVSITLKKPVDTQPTQFIRIRAYDRRQVSE